MKKILLALLLAAPVAWAVDVYPSNNGGLIGRADGGYLPMSTLNCGDNLLCTFNRSTQTMTLRVNGWQGSLDYDFPALSDYPKGPACAVSNTVSIPGLELADFCQASSNLGVDGGTTMSTDIVLTGLIDTANTARVQACVHISDAGVVDIPDASYFLMCFSRRP